MQCRVFQRVFEKAMRAVLKSLSFKYGNIRALKRLRRTILSSVPIGVQSCYNPWSCGYIPFEKGQLSRGEFSVTKFSGFLYNDKSHSLCPQ